jgi:hypothetical protein
VERTTFPARKTDVSRGKGRPAADGAGGRSGNPVSHVAALRKTPMPQKKFRIMQQKWPEIRLSS